MSDKRYFNANMSNRLTSTLRDYCDEANLECRINDINDDFKIIIAPDTSVAIKIAKWLIANGVRYTCYLYKKVTY